MSAVRIRSSAASLACRTVCFERTPSRSPTDRAGLITTGYGNVAKSRLARLSRVGISHCCGTLMPSFLAPSRSVPACRSQRETCRSAERGSTLERTVCAHRAPRVMRAPPRVSRHRCLASLRTSRAWPRSRRVGAADRAPRGRAKLGGRPQPEYVAVGRTRAHQNQRCLTTGRRREQLAHRRRSPIRTSLAAMGGERRNFSAMQTCSPASNAKM